MTVLMVLGLTDNVQLITFGMVSNSEGQFGLAKLFNAGFLSPDLGNLGKQKGGGGLVCPDRILHVENFIFSE